MILLVTVVFFCRRFASLHNFNKVVC